MNCIEFRRIALANPGLLDANMRRHLESCPACAGLSVDLEALEAELRQAVQVPVPEGLAERLLVRRGGGTKWFTRVAAAAVLVLGLGFGLVYQQERAAQMLASEMIEHVLSEPEVFDVQGEVPPARVMTALASVGTSPQADIGRVSFLDNCKGLDPGGTHMLVHTAFGRAAVLLLPNVEYRRSTRVSVQGLSAALFPAPQGVIAIVADSPDIVARVEGHLQRSLRLRI